MCKYGTLQSRHNDRCKMGCKVPVGGQLFEINGRDVRPSSQAELSWHIGEAYTRQGWEYAAEILQEGLGLKWTPLIRKSLQRLNFLMHEHNREDQLTRSDPDGWRMSVLQRVVNGLNSYFEYDYDIHSDVLEFHRLPGAGMEDMLELIIFNPKNDHLNYVFQEPQAIVVLQPPQSTPLRNVEARSEKDEGGEETTCPVCFQEYGSECNAVQLLPCAHVLCAGCLDAWFKNNNTCPSCRYVYRVKQIAHSLARAWRELLRSI